jgi:hypothetical protein
VSLSWEFAGEAGWDAPPEPIETQDAYCPPGQWFACKYPERPFGGDTWLHDGCTACLVALEAEFRLGRNDGTEMESIRAQIERWGLAPRRAEGES